MCTHISEASLGGLRVLDSDLVLLTAGFALNLFRNAAGVMRLVFLISGSSCSSNKNTLVFNTKKKKSAKKKKCRTSCHALSFAFHFLFIFDCQLLKISVSREQISK